MKSVTVLTLVIWISAAAFVYAAEKPGYDENLIGSWTDSYEEKEKWSDPNIYRRSDSRKFPPSRFRMEYVFNKDMTCKYMHLDPADRHRMVEGTWNVHPQDNKQILIYDAKGKLQRKVSFKIVKLTKDELRTTKLLPAVQK